jgi:hypothetical protein
LRKRIVISLGSREKESIQHRLQTKKACNKRSATIKIGIDRCGQVNRLIVGRGQNEYSATVLRFERNVSDRKIRKQFCQHEVDEEDFSIEQRTGNLPLPRPSEIVRRSVPPNIWCWNRRLSSSFLFQSEIYIISFIETYL